jgi:hypothetical protein
MKTGCSGAIAVKSNSREAFSADHDAVGRGRKVNSRENVTENVIELSRSVQAQKMGRLAKSGTISLCSSAFICAYELCFLTAVHVWTLGISFAHK